MPGDEKHPDLVEQSHRDVDNQIDQEVMEELREKAKSLPPLQDIGRKDLDRQDAIYFLGLMAAHGLKSFGQVNMVIGEDDKVCLANPIHVYFDAKAYIHDDTELPPFKWKRPVVSEGRPQYVAWRKGELWEIEFEEPETESI